MYSSGDLVKTKEISWFEMKLLGIAQTPQRVVYGRLFKGICDFYMAKQMEESKKFEFETDRAICGIKGTNFILEATDTQTLLKVIEGTVEFTSKKDGQVATVEAGQMMSAIDSGLGQKFSFDAKAKWGPMPPPDINTDSATTSTTSSSSTTKKPGLARPKCPLTTAMGEDPDAPGLAIFRSFRDRVLAKS